jgi:hypothetical protein
MARKDLTALAALGTLGYMLSKKGDKVDASAAERRIAADKEASAEPQSMEDDSGKDPMEEANKRVERTLTNPNARERGEAGTSETVSPTKKPVARKPAAKTVPRVVRDNTAMLEANNPAGYTGQDLRGENDMSAYRPRRAPVPLTEVRRPGRNVNYENLDASEMKRGGKVKKMASGGMTASKRADGIATRGKTKCKMY